MMKTLTGPVITERIDIPAPATEFKRWLQVMEPGRLRELFGSVFEDAIHARPIGEHVWILPGGNWRQRVKDFEDVNFRRWPERPHIRISALGGEQVVFSRRLIDPIADSEVEAAQQNLKEIAQRTGNAFKVLNAIGIKFSAGLE